MKKLFKIFRGAGPDGQTVGYYELKAAAKLDRNNANRERDKPGGGAWVVSRGPDHWRGESFNVTLNPTPSSKAPAR